MPSTRIPDSSTGPLSQVLQSLVEHSYLFRGWDPVALAGELKIEVNQIEKFYASQSLFTAFQPEKSLQNLYVVLAGGPIIIRSSPLDRIIGINYPGSCLGMRNLPFSYGLLDYAFPSLVEAYKTTTVLRISLEAFQELYRNHESLQHRYKRLFELREKFQYHLLNCSAYPPQAVATVLKALVYQEQELGSQPDSAGTFTFDLPIDIIARASQLNPRTVEQVLKGMSQVGVIQLHPEAGGDGLSIRDLEQLDEIYGITRGKVNWWPLSR
ncbi:MAG: hypothetical protein Q6L68_02425 [Thermostichus sp. DG02_5_bins_236]